MKSELLLEFLQDSSLIWWLNLKLHELVLYVFNQPISHWVINLIPVGALALYKNHRQYHNFRQYNPTWNAQKKKNVWRFKKANSRGGIQTNVTSTEFTMVINYISDTRFIKLIYLCKLSKICKLVAWKTMTMKYLFSISVSMPGTESRYIFAAISDYSWTSPETRMSQAFVNSARWPKNPECWTVSHTAAVYLHYTKASTCKAGAQTPTFIWNANLFAAHFLIWQPGGRNELILPEKKHVPATAVHSHSAFTLSGLFKQHEELKIPNNSQEKG